MKNLIITLAIAATFAAAGSFAASAQTVSPSGNQQAVSPSGKLTGESTASTVRRKGRVLLADGRKLTRIETLEYVSAHCGPEYARSWNAGANLYGAGTGLLISSAVTLPAGVVVSAIGAAHIVGGAVGGSLGAAISGSLGGDTGIDPEARKTINTGAALLWGGVALLAIGTSTVIAGAVCVPIGKSKMNNVVNRCNAAGREVTMNFGPCPHGLGVTLNF